MFKSVLKVNGLFLELNVFEWPVINSPISIMWPGKTLYNENGFSVRQMNNIEIRFHTQGDKDLTLWLPGTTDGLNPRQINTMFQAPNQELLYLWIDGYRKAYQALNGEPAMILGELTMETVG